MADLFTYLEIESNNITKDLCGVVTSRQEEEH